jgi:uncharacterized lipoprotein
MIMSKAKWISVAALWCLLCGCAPLILFGAGGAAGVAGYKYYEGGLIVIYEAPYMETWDATLVALEQMNLVVERTDHDLTKGTIVAKRVDKSPVSVSLEYKSARETEAVIRVGHLGDEKASEAIKDKIRDVLFKKS